MCVGVDVFLLRVLCFVVFCDCPSLFLTVFLMCVVFAVFGVYINTMCVSIKFVDFVFVECELMVGCCPVVVCVLCKCVLV